MKARLATKQELTHFVDNYSKYKPNDMGPIISAIVFLYNDRSWLIEKSGLGDVWPDTIPLGGQDAVQWRNDKGATS